MPFPTHLPIGPLLSLQRLRSWDWATTGNFCLVFRTEIVECGILLIPSHFWLETLTALSVGGVAHYCQFCVLCPMGFHMS